MCLCINSAFGFHWDYLANYPFVRFPRFSWCLATSVVKWLERHGEYGSGIFKILHLWICVCYGVRRRICLWYFPNSFTFCVLPTPLNGRSLCFKAGHLGSFFLEENKSPDLSNRKVLMTFWIISSESIYVLKISRWRTVVLVTKGREIFGIRRSFWLKLLHMGMILKSSYLMSWLKFLPVALISFSVKLLAELL